MVFDSVVLCLYGFNLCGSIVLWCMVLSFFYYIWFINILFCRLFWFSSSIVLSLVPYIYDSLLYMGSVSP